MTPPRTPVRDLAIGITVGGTLLALMFVGSFGMIEAATLAMTVVVFIWAATVDPARLVDERRRPAVMLFGLGLVGIALIFTVATLISTVTEYLALLVAVAAFGVAMTRAVRYGWSAGGGD